MNDAKRVGGVVWVESSKVQEGAWWVKDLLVNLRRERTEGRCSVMMSEEAMEIRRLSRLKSFVGDA